MTEQEKASSESKLEASAAEGITPRCSSICGKKIPFNGNCQSQCDQRERHSGTHYCPTHGAFA